MEKDKSEKPVKSEATEKPAANSRTRKLLHSLWKRPYWLTAGLLFLGALILALVFLPSGKSKDIEIGILTTNVTENEELDGIKKYLDQYDHLNYQLLNLTSPLSELPSLKQFDVLWYHQVDTAAIPIRLNNIQINDSLKKYVQTGGNLLLTMEALKYLNDLRVENVEPVVDTLNVRESGYGGKYGLHAYKTHPVFNGLNGGAYIFNPKSDTDIRRLGFMGDQVPGSGKVIAVDWSYINFDESKKFMVEYDEGKGKIIGIGAYTVFTTPNYHTPQLEEFMNNVFGYLAGTVTGEQNYWNYDPNSVESFNLVNKEVQLPKAKDWNEKDWELYFKHAATDNFWDVAGERMLVMGRENGGIEEIWAHPFMAMRDYRIGYRPDGNSDIVWLDDSVEEVEVTPNAFIRSYSIGKNHLREIITADIKDPVAAIHYDYSGDDSIRLVTQYKTNMRFMWPYSSKVNGIIKQTRHEGLNAHLYVDQSSELTCIAGAGKKPVRQLSGQFSDFSATDTGFKGKATDDFMVSTIAEYPLNQSDHLDILIAATNQGLGKATGVYEKYMKRPEKVYQQSQKYYEALLAGKTMIETPDESFNKAYKWALIGTDRFFVHTPGLGKSLVAGYATTAKGWDGDHEVSGRPGYGWYFGRDGQWSGIALNGYGDFDKVRDILKIYMDFQSPRGKIFHELTTSGVAHYDAADATPLFIVLAGHYLRHSGDEDFIKENWEPIEKAIEFCFSTDRNNDHLIDNTLVGHGWVEGGHLYGGRSTLYLSGCWAQALEEAAYMAEAIGESGEQKYRKEADKVKQIINDTLWNEQKQFFYHSINNDGTFIEDETVMPAIPLYFGQVEEDKKNPVLEKLARDNFTSDWGVRIAGKDNEHFNPEGYHTGTVWPLYTGWTALAEYKNDRPLQGFVHTMNNLQVYKHWSKGFVEEVMHGLEYKPSGICAHQCWSETMALQPLYEGMLGYEPVATENKMTFAPAFPIQWEDVEVSNIRMDEHNISLAMHKTDTAQIYTFNKPGKLKLKIQFNPYLPVASIVDSVTLNGRKIDYDTRKEKDFLQLQMRFEPSQKNTLAIHYTEGIGIVPLVPSPEPGEESDGLRIISAELRDNNYLVTVEGPVNATKEFYIYPGYKKVKYVEGAKLMEYMQDKIRMRIRFRPEDQEEGYMKKQFRLILEER